MATADTLLRNIPHKTLHEIAKMLDPDNMMDWRMLAGSIIDPRTNENRYSINDIQNFELEFRRGNSPTFAVIKDWMTHNATVGQLVSVLQKIQREDVVDKIMPAEAADNILERNPHQIHYADRNGISQQNGGLVVQEQNDQVNDDNNDNDDDDDDDEDNHLDDNEGNDRNIGQFDQLADPDEDREDEQRDAAVHDGQLDEGLNDPDIVAEFQELRLSNSLTDIL